MKVEQNNQNPDSFTNAAVIMEDEDECLGTISEAKTTAQSGQSKPKQTLLTETDGPDAEAMISSLQGERWKKLSRQIRGAIAVKNAVKPRRKKSGRRSTANIDPFLQKFSTRDIGLTTQASRVSLHPIEEDKPECSDADEVTSEEEDNTNHTILTYLRFTCGACYPTGVIDPDGSFLYCWVYLLITAIRYNFWVIILRVAFSEAQQNYAALWWVLDSVSDFIYLADIAINCRVGFVEEGILVKDPARAYKRYLKSPTFFLDVVSVLPLELWYFRTGVQPILRFPRLVKVYKSQEIKSRLEGRSNHPTIVRVFFLVHLMFMLIHWNAGIYFLISRAEGFGSNEWLYPALNGSYDTLTRKYVRSFYWSTLTLTTIGDLPSPVTNVEYIYTIASYLSGVFIFAMIVGNSGSIILNSNASRLEFEKQRDNAKSYMKIHDVPGELQRRVLKWYDYSWSRGRMGDEGGDLNSLHVLPDKMKTEIALHVHLETLKKMDIVSCKWREDQLFSDAESRSKVVDLRALQITVTFLQNCEPEFLHELLLKMKLHIFTPGDLIIRHGEIAREMYLIAHGRIEVTSETGKHLKELGSGDFFGEIGILSLSEGQNRRTADVRSIGYTECFVLSKNDVLGEIQQFPHAQEILAEYGRKRLQNTGSEDPRLIALDSDESLSHVIEIDSAENSEKGFGRGAKNKNKLKQDGRRDCASKEHDPVKRSLFKTTKELIASGLVKNENKEECVGNVKIRDDTDNEEGKQSRDSTCDLDSCLDSLDNLKTVLQNAVENEIEKYKEHISRLENQLAIEKERSCQSKQKIKTQAKEISELSSLNKALGQYITEKDNKISEMEHELLKNSDYDHGRKEVNVSDVNEQDVNEQEVKTVTRETILLKQDDEDLSNGTRLSPTEMKLTFCDTAC